MKLVLGSGSQRRRELLESLGLDFEVVAPNVNEARLPDEPPPVYVERIARLKAEAVVDAGLIVISADTTVVHRGRVMGKPGHPSEARAMLRKLQGSKHEVFTGLAVAAGGPSPRVASLVAATEVTMVPMTDDEIAQYVATGEPMDKAGAYALQGKAAVFVEAVAGSPSNVIGLPVHLLPRLLRSAGVDIEQFVMSELEL